MTPSLLHLIKSANNYQQISKILDEKKVLSRQRKRFAFFKIFLDFGYIKLTQLRNCESIGCDLCRVVHDRRIIDVSKEHRLDFEKMC